MTFPNRLFSQGEARWKLFRSIIKFRSPQVNIHKNVRLTAKGRAYQLHDVASLIVSISTGMTLEAAGVIVAGTPDSMGWARKL